MVICPICSKELNCINHNHVKTHGLTVNQFKTLYPNCIMVSEKTSKNLSRKNNVNYVAYVERYSLERKAKTIEKFKLLNKRCKHCNEPILFEKRMNNFCNHSCSASYTLKGRKVIYSEQALKNLQESGRKNIPKKIAILVKKECIFCGSTFEVRNKYKYRKTCGAECLKKHRSVNNARQGTYGKCGYYKGIFCGSTWELAFLVFNLDNGKDIKRCDLKFSYELEDGEHTYFPDFIMDNVIYEVKGREYGSIFEKNKAVEDAGYEIVIIRKKEINPIIKEVKSRYKVKDLLVLYDIKG